MSQPPRLGGTHSNPILSRLSKRTLSSLSFKSEKGLGAAAPAAVLYNCFTSMRPSVLGCKSTTLGLFICWVRVVLEFVGKVGMALSLRRPPPLRRGHLRFEAGGDMEATSVCWRPRLELVVRRRLSIVVVGNGRRDGRRAIANGRNERGDAIILFLYTQKSLTRK